MDDIINASIKSQTDAPSGMLRAAQAKEIAELRATPQHVEDPRIHTTPEGQTFVTFGNRLIKLGGGTVYEKPDWATRTGSTRIAVTEDGVELNDYIQVWTGRVTQTMRRDAYKAWLADEIKRKSDLKAGQNGPAASAQPATNAPAYPSWDPGGLGIRQRRP